MNRIQQTESSHTSQGWLLAAFLLGLIIFSAYFFMQRDWWLPELASVHGASLDREFHLTLAITGTMFVLIHLALAFLVVKFRKQGATGRYRTPSRRFELRFAIVAGLLIFVVDVFLFLMGNASFRSLYAGAPADSIVVEVIGEQFAWNFHYPGPDGVFGRRDPALIDLDSNPIGMDMDDPAGEDDIIQINQMHLPVDRAVRVQIRAKDVIHSFALPHLRVKQDAVPGMMVETWFVPTQTGEFEIVCNQLCGLGHYRMRGVLTVETEEEFEQWLAEGGS